MLHGKALAIVIAYDMYKECCEGLLNPTWKCEPVDFHRFRDRLAKQMLTYNPTNLHYMGDERFRVSTQLNKARRRKTPSSSSTATVESTYSTSTGVDRNILEGATGRVCGFLSDLLQHEASVVRLPNKKHLQCMCCGKQAYYKCTLCPGEPPLHMPPPPAPAAAAANETAENDVRKNSCFLHYHNTGSLGAWKGDWHFKHGARRKDWKLPDAMVLRENERQMKRLASQLEEEHERAKRSAATAAVVPAQAHSSPPPPRAAGPVQFADTSHRSRRRRRRLLTDSTDTIPINYNNVI